MYTVCEEGEAHINAQVVVVSTGSKPPFISSARHLSPETATLVATKDDVAGQLPLPSLWSARVPEIKRSLQSCTTRDGFEGLLLCSGRVHGV